jgi:hypothetical protein
LQVPGAILQVSGATSPARLESFPGKREGSEIFDFLRRQNLALSGRVHDASFSFFLREDRDCGERRLSRNGGLRAVVETYRVGGDRSRRTEHLRNE